MKTDATTGEKYFWHPTSGATTWDPPLAKKAAPVPAPAPAAYGAPADSYGRGGAQPAAAYDPYAASYDPRGDPRGGDPRGPRGDPYPRAGAPYHDAPAAPPAYHDASGFKRPQQDQPPPGAYDKRRAFEAAETARGLNNQPAWMRDRR